MNSDACDFFLNTADWLKERDLPVALTLTETLEPATGPEAIIFPPTYAFRDKAYKERGEHPYAITTVREGLSPEEATRQGLEANVCDLDSVGSQANRMEPAFGQPPLSSLVPQVVIRAGEMRASLLDAGHRVADGAVRFSGLADEVARAIAALARQANADTLARLAPTSLVFGFWDSRNLDYQYKHPRLLTSTIRATNVALFKRSAQFNPTFDPAALKNANLLEVSTAELAAEDSTEPEKKAEANAKNPFSQQGLLSAPAVDTHGGVRVYGQIVRRTEINLVALRALAVTAEGKVNEAGSILLRRYLLGLALVAARTQAAYNLRQGCLLVGVENTPPAPRLVYPSGRREEFAWEFAATLGFAQEAARAFGVYDESATVREVSFQPAKVAEAIAGKDKKAARKAKA